VICCDAHDIGGVREGREREREKEKKKKDG
jgi:hypothetical protein